MAIDRWSPFAEIRRIDDALSRALRGGIGSISETPEAWNIPLDVTRNGDDVVVKASLPGVDRENIDLTIEESVLTIRAQVSEEKSEEENGYLLRERRTGSFYRAVRLPESVDSENAESSYKDGVLTVRLPKQEEKKARKLTVSAV